MAFQILSTGGVNPQPHKKGALDILPDSASFQNGAEGRNSSGNEVNPRHFFPLILLWTCRHNLHHFQGSPQSNADRNAMVSDLLGFQNQPNGLQFQ